MIVLAFRYNIDGQLEPAVYRGEHNPSDWDIDSRCVVVDSQGMVIGEVVEGRDDPRKIRVAPAGTKLVQHQR